MTLNHPPQTSEPAYFIATDGSTTIHPLNDSGMDPFQQYLAATHEYASDGVAECRASGIHHTSTSPDGYCNACGSDEPLDENQPV